MTESLLEAVLNLSQFHREHEKYYAQEPRAHAVVLQRHARAFQALADRWSATEPSSQEALNPFEGSRDLNDSVALQLDGILFMEGQGEPPEIARMKREIRALAEDQATTGAWLADAMTTTWEAARTLLEYTELADQLGERHRIIANDWQAAEMSQLAGRLLVRALDLLDQVDFTPQVLREDLAGVRRVPGYLHSAAELLGRAADLLSDSAGLVRENERRWRIFRAHVEEIVNEGRC